LLDCRWSSTPGTASFAGASGFILLMRVFLATLAAAGALAVASPAAVNAQGGAAAPTSGAPSANAPALRTMSRALGNDVALARRTSGALVQDLTTGQTLYSYAPTVGRLPASVEKLYTTTTALMRFGATARLTTSVLGVGHFDSHDGWHGTLYLKGGGDPTFGSAGYDRFAYGTGTTMQQLVASLVKATGITSVSGAIVGDESYFDSLRGTAPYGYGPATDIEGQLSALIYNRGLANTAGTAFQGRPALFATQQFAAALSAAHVRVPRSTSIYTGVTPSSAKSLADVHSPTIGTLIRLTNTPSDNFFAEMLLKGVGASFGGAGTTAAGAAVVRSQMASSFDIHPRLNDGSGLSRSDSTTPAQVVRLLQGMQDNATFTSSLSIAGETGTMEDGLRGTAAQGRCRGKTGTLHDVANLAGYCTARDGHMLAFAFLMNSVDPVAGHDDEDQMAVALARYNG
jgi:D-alanyl-D-alanine carboxypeptidase/D-alanyl-D-alanine-endopeptidase (penicillin-binding protein 4)